MVLIVPAIRMKSSKGSQASLELDNSHRRRLFEAGARLAAPDSRRATRPEPWGARKTTSRKSST
eukprot:5090394-Prymnesium_polylepis.1